MTYNIEKFRIRTVELVFFAIAVILLLILGVIARGQTGTQAKNVARGHSQIQRPLYREYRGASRHDGGGSESETWRAGDEK